MKKKALKAAFPHTIPILFSFIFMGMVYGIYMNVSGFSFLYPMIISIVLYGGSLQFVVVAMLLSPFAPIQALVTAFVVQARHLFYGISMLNKYKGMGWKKIYLVFAMCDETFSINYSVEPPKDVDKGWFMFFVSLLDQIYWVTGATVGGIIGTLFTFDTSGIDFVMTALFVVILLEQVLKEEKPYLAIIGLAIAIASRLGFGADSFLIPTMICIAVVLIIFKKPLEKSLNLDYSDEREIMQREDV